MKMTIGEKIKRFFGSGDFGLYRSPEKANNINTSMISTEMEVLGNMFKRSGLAEEIANEKIALKKDFAEFHEKFIKKELKTDEAEKINNQFTLRIENLQEKMNDLQGIKNDLKDLRNKKENQKNEFENEMQLHKVRFDEDLLKGRF